MCAFKYAFLGSLIEILFQTVLLVMNIRDGMTHWLTCIAIRSQRRLFDSTFSTLHFRPLTPILLDYESTRTLGLDLTQ